MELNRKRLKLKSGVVSEGSSLCLWTSVEALSLLSFKERSKKRGRPKLELSMDGLRQKLELSMDGLRQKLELSLTFEGICLFHGMPLNSRA
jgi:hypothetical protein